MTGEFGGCLGKSILGRGNSQCKGPGVGLSLVRGAVRPVHWNRAGEGRVLGDEVREAKGLGCGENLTFTFNEVN